MRLLRINRFSLLYSRRAPYLIYLYFLREISSDRKIGADCRERKGGGGGAIVLPGVSLNLAGVLARIRSAVKSRKRVYQRLTREFDEIVNSFVRASRPPGRCTRE